MAASRGPPALQGVGICHSAQAVEEVDQWSYWPIFEMLKRASSRREILHTDFITPRVLEKLLTTVPDIVAALSISGDFSFQPCSPRDFLGSILGTGIAREKVGILFCWRSNSWDKPIQNRMQKVFEKGYLRRESAANTLPRSSQRKQLSRESKEMLRRKVKEIEAYNASNVRAAIKEKKNGKATTRKERRARCYICKKRGHVFWKCQNKGNTTTPGTPTVENKTREPIMVEDEEVFKYPEDVHVKTNYMVEGTDFSNWNNIWYVSNAYKKHMSPTKSLFKRLKSRFRMEQTQHEKKIIFSHEIREAVVETNENEIVIPCVLYTPEVTLNVLTLDQLLAQGFVITYGHDKCRISYMFREDKKIYDGESDYGKGKGYPKDACPLIKGLEELKWDRNMVQDYLDDDYISVNGTLYAIKIGEVNETKKGKFAGKCCEYVTKEQSKKQLSRESKEMLRRKVKEIEAYNASNVRAAIKEKKNGKATTRKERRARCYICKKRGHVLWKCQNKGNTATPRTPTVENKTREPIMVEDEEVFKYPEDVHVKTNYMVEGTGFSNWNNIWYVSNAYKKHMSPTKSLFKRLKSRFRKEQTQHEKKFIFSHGIGEAVVGTNENEIVIPCVLYTPEVTLNVLSLDQLLAQGKGCDVKTESMIAKQNKYLEEYFDSIDHKDACPLIKGLEELKWDRNMVQDYLDDDYISVNGTLYAIK
nr:ARID DNA-binding domain-containing protein [Tanacetum cinerariifolium]